MLRLRSISQGNGVARTLKKVTHLKGRLLDQAVILSNSVPSPKGKNLLPEGEQILSFKSSTLWHGNHFYHIR